ncbi:MAG: Gmad2 immunoglobulin-like domain-containing protein [Chloroflexi bacterium]|nr:Gmad2 immunoglobulin-like domain-containing protein [Chloroflexota bacterium]
MLPKFGRALALFSLCAMIALSACSASSGAAQKAPSPTAATRANTPILIPPKPPASTQPQPAIVVAAPLAGQVVKSPVRVSGTAQVFEGTVSVAVKDGAGKVLGKGLATASAGAPSRGTFSADIAFTQPATSQAGTVEVYSESPKDGSVRDLVAIRVTLAGR